MATNFDDARDIIGRAASERAERFAQDEEFRALDSAVGRIVKEDIDSPISTPTFDAVAISGYAVIATQVSRATPERPTRMRCMGLMKAGDHPLEVDDRVVNGMVCCVEITVGAAFPTAKSTGRPFDSIVPREHAEIVQEGGSGRILQITRLPLTSWHKRITGSDFRKGDRIIDRGMSIAPKFLVTPYIRALIGMQTECAISARVAFTQATPIFSRHDRPSPKSNEMVVDGSMDYDTFRHAILRSQIDGVSVEIAKERSPAKASPFASSNCWMHVPRGHMSVGDGDLANIYPFCSPKS
ncbi:hypothetical protein LTR32_004606 [Rachicladosporium monterosium]|uniref:MoeA N-terminal and linker domain-containing protein n=1 Tax=Rachicladosporium monterosium TaxID=1507873 RepID=A0ABR0L435_9PEZI|nr:hypothetical protein LTR32_004606 [Rachicladosporium monterosium]